MKIHIVTTDFLDSNIYFLEIEKHKIMIDCGATAPFIKSLLTDISFVPDYILLTHGHIDHILSLPVFSNMGTMVFIHKADEHYLTDPTYNLSAKLIGSDFMFNQRVYNYDELPQELGIEVISVPGHSPGSVALKTKDAVFTGDTLFCGGIGNTMFPGGDARMEHESLKKLLTLPGEMIVYPGHGCPTTISNEQNLIF